MFIVQSSPDDWASVEILESTEDMVRVRVVYTNGIPGYEVGQLLCASAQLDRRPPRGCSYVERFAAPFPDQPGISEWLKRTSMPACGDNIGGDLFILVRCRTGPAVKVPAARSTRR